MLIIANISLEIPWNTIIARMPFHFLLLKRVFWTSVAEDWLIRLANLCLKMFSRELQQHAMVALHPQVKGVSGQYFSDCNIAKPSSQAKDPELAKKLWEFSMNLVK
ncbi:Short-chain dehydrogenase TIC 32, chloroplastic [Vitis vinifera]|uniref:Short-chain dehydrogenase TIC 32, chloroplastic n=1 Tax=Vitis vinifera TaxID=29760 RepID=A0A438E2M8_VITVI|nr:Short-chain dehydrogenase TIC 32, chloroplastic [Vitis vinifera]